MENSPKLEKKIGAGTYFLALLAFIPMVGVLLGFICIIYGLIQRKRGGIGVAGIGFAGILCSLAVFGYLSRQLDHPTGDFAKAQTQLLKTRILPDMVKQIEYFKIQNGKYPRLLEEVGPEARDTVKLYEGNSLAKITYQLSPDRNSYYLLSAGIDGTPFTADDVFPDISTDEMAKVGFRKKALP
jgi:hypothetical protein